MTTIPVRPPLSILNERIDSSLLQLHALPGLDARGVARAVGLPVLSVRAAHWLHRRSSLRSSLARIRVEAAELVLREAAATLPIPTVLERAAESAGFSSIETMDRAFLRLRHRTSCDLLVTTRTVRAA